MPLSAALSTVLDRAGFERSDKQTPPAAAIGVPMSHGLTSWLDMAGV
jgi:hypothetical protein